MNYGHRIGSMKGLTDNLFGSLGEYAGGLGAETAAATSVASSTGYDAGAALSALPSDLYSGAGYLASAALSPLSDLQSGLQSTVRSAETTFLIGALLLGGILVLIEL